MSLSMTISVCGSHVAETAKIPYSPGLNVHQAMEAAYNLSPNHIYAFDLEYFGQQLGYEVIGIDNITSQSGPAYGIFTFWALYINGQLSETGIDETILHDGDEIGWNYERYSEEAHGGTRYEQIRRLFTATRAMSSS